MSGQKPVVLVIDDEVGILDAVHRFAQEVGYDAVTFSNGRDAIAHLQMHRADLVLVDPDMPGVGGLDMLSELRDFDPRCQTVLMSGDPSVDTAVEAIKLGASDYLTKPLDAGRLEQLLAGVRDDLERRRHVLSIESDMARRLEFAGMVGRGPAMQELFGMIRRLAPHVRHALVTGEAGSGKELVARALHRTGPRKDRRFVTVNCCAAAGPLFEDELFEHVRGATEQKESPFELADGGTLFFDDVAALPPAVQGKLLRVLELGEVHRVGSAEPRRVNVHVIGATNRDLRAEVALGRFRSDLYYRLNVVELQLPPLRDRREDIPYLTAAFVHEMAERFQKPLAGVTAGAERLLAAAAWDGNVRELRQVIEQACASADGDFITEKDLAISIPPVAVAAVRVVAGRAARPEPAAADLLITVEREHIQRALAQARGNKKAAARMLGLSRRALYRRLERLDLGDTIIRRREPALRHAVSV